MMQRNGWEYQLVHMGNPLQEDVQERANAFGKLGWELTTIDAGVWVFKRSIESHEAESAVEAAIEQTVPIATASYIEVPPPARPAIASRGPQGAADWLGPSPLG